MSNLQDHLREQDAITAAHEATVTDYIDMTPTFEGVAGSIIALLECGDGKGRKWARAELTRWAKMLDAAKTEQEVRKMRGISL